MKLIPNYEDYLISTDGKIWSNKTNKYLTPKYDKAGYVTIALYKGSRGSRKTLKIHRLVAITFIKNTENKPQVNHINGIKYDNRVENLEWNTSSENNLHAFKIGLRVNSENNRRLSGMRCKKLSEINSLKVRCKITGKIYKSITEAANSIGFSKSTLAKQLKGINPNTTAFLITVS